MGAATTVSLLVLPYILRVLGKKVLPKLATKAMTNKGAVITGKTIPVLNKYGNPMIRKGQPVMQKLPDTLPQDTALSKALSGAGKATAAIGNAGTFITPLAVGLGGSAIRGAGQLAGGALSGGTSLAGNVLAGVGRMPLHYGTQSQAKKDLYGGTPLDMFGGALADITGGLGKGVAGLGQGIGQGVSGATQAVGEGVGNIAKQMQLLNMYDMLDSRLLQQTQGIKEMTKGMTPGQLQVLGRVVSSGKGV